jgi:hypothetical protein
MATQKFKAALNNSKFPFLYRNASRGVLQPGLDPASRLPGNFPGTYDSSDYNTIQMLYCENVLPTVDGLASVSFTETIPATFGNVLIPGGGGMDRFYVMRTDDETAYVFGLATQTGYTWDPVKGNWTSNFFAFTDITQKSVSTSYVAGRSFLLIENLAYLEFGPGGWGSPGLSLPPGYTFSDLVAGCGASNYNVLATATEILWSTLSDVLEFNDIDQGSGRQTPIDLKGKIRALIPISGGFIIYTTKNAVAAFFTNNAASPFLFKEVIGSAGVVSDQEVTGDANMNYHYTYGQAGLQKVSLQKAESVLPGCADFLSGSAYDQWNNTTHLVEQVNSGQTKVRLYLALSRYLCISYGYTNPSFKFALIYDLLLERWGKIKLDHVDIGTLPWLDDAGTLRPILIEELGLGIQYYPDAIQDLSYGIPDPDNPTANVNWRDTLGFLQVEGTVQAVNVETAGEANEVGTGVVVMGHVQVTRSRTVTLQDLQLDGMHAGHVYILTSDPGHGYSRDDAIEATLQTDLTNFKTYRKRVTTENFDIAVRGSFMLTNAVVETTVHGSR